MAVGPCSFRPRTTHGNAFSNKAKRNTYYILPNFTTPASLLSIEVIIVVINMNYCYYYHHDYYTCFGILPNSLHLNIETQLYQFWRQ